jgi:hypothetical protein
VSINAQLRPGRIRRASPFALAGVITAEGYQTGEDVIRSVSTRRGSGLSFVTREGQDNMSDTGKPRPGRISGEQLPFATGRGMDGTRTGGGANPVNRDRDARGRPREEDLHLLQKEETNKEEDIDPSSRLGLVMYRREPYPLEPDERLRHEMVRGILVVLGLAILIALIGIIVVTTTGGDAASLTGYSSDILDKLVSLLALILGYVFGRQSRSRQSGRRGGSR